MEKFLLVITALSIIVILNTKPSAAETPVGTDEKIILIQSCEKIYPDLEKLGTEKFRQRYQYHMNFRSCTILFNDLLWYSNDTDRTEKLVALLDKPTVPMPVRDRLTQSQTIPEWIKDDAIRWQQGKEKDTVFSYGIRYMITSDMIPALTNISDPNYCENRICAVQNDFLKYSIKNTGIQDVITLTHTFQNVNENSLIILAQEVSKSGKTTNTFQINEDGLASLADQKCCDYYRFMHKMPLQIGTKIGSTFDAQLTDEIVYPFMDQKRPALIAKDHTDSYYEIIDKQTGAVLFAKHQDRIRKTIWTAELVETNIFTKDIKIQYEDMRIPPWFKNVVRWWTEGKITDTEYLSGLGYLIKHDVLYV
ncbi:MAG TPA: hypothetical protein VGA92_06125 [Candidatus Nitrosotenuis sp.]